MSSDGADRDIRDGCQRVGSIERGLLLQYSEEKGICEIDGIRPDSRSDLSDKPGSDRREQTRLTQKDAVEVNGMCKDVNALTKSKEMSKFPTHLEIKLLSCSSVTLLWTVQKRVDGVGDFV